MTEKDKQRAIENYTPQYPQRIEFGGDYYYKCPWISCGADVREGDNYCSVCGQRINWSDLRFRRFLKGVEKSDSYRRN